MVMLIVEKESLKGEGLISVPPASFPGALMSRFTHFIRSRVSSVTLNPMDSETDEPLYGAEEAARRSSTGKQVAYNGKPFTSLIKI